MNKARIKRCLQIVMVTLLIGCIAAGVTCSTKKAFDLLYADAKESILVISHQETERLALLFHNKVNLASQLASVIGNCASYNPQSIEAAIREASAVTQEYLDQSSLPSAVGVIDRNGVYYDVDGHENNLSISEAECIKEGFSGQLAISMPYVDALSQQEVMAFVAPIRVDNAISAVLCIEETMDSLYAPGSASIFGGEAYSFLIAQNGDVMLRLSNCHERVPYDNLFAGLGAYPQNAKILPAVMQEIKVRQEGMVSIWGPGGEKSMLYYSTIDQMNGWALVLMAPQSILFASMHRIIAVMALIYGLSILLIIAVLLLISKQRQEQNEYIEQLAFHDKLTGIPNKNYFELYGEQFLSDDYSDRHRYAIAIFDIENFNVINELNGFQHGDWVLCQIARILQEEINSDEEAIYRDYGDVFGMLLIYEDNVRLNKRLLFMFQQINRVLYQENTSIGTVEFCCGIYVIEEPRQSLLLMMDWANMARKSLKGQVPNRQIAYYDTAMRQELLSNKELENELGMALENKEIFPYFQPKIDLDKEEICGAEALIRWQKGDTILSPAAFVPLFERNGEIDKLDFYIFEQICQLKQHWRLEKKKNIVISVNMSRNHLHQNDFVDQLITIADRYQVPHGELEIEMTETLFFKDNIRLIEVMKRIKAAGFQLAIDDFGTGYSSLNLLKEIPADVLKLDREFLGDMQREPGSGQCIIRHVVNMAHELHMQVVSEGVESQEQVDFLRSIGCRVAQGYYYARPMPIAPFEHDFLAQEKPPAQDEQEK